MLGGDPKDPSESGGYYIPPTIIADIAPDATISQEEIFGPVLAFIRARDFDHAMEIFNNTEFGLTGSLYSSVRERLDLAVDEFHVGNLYLNRKCTGALVGVHPFGGFNMSGTDSKAGGPDYLLLFTQAKSIAEKADGASGHGHGNRPAAAHRGRARVDPPALRSDGGDVEFIDFDEDDGIVQLRLVGACGTCPISTMTLKQGIERRIMMAVPEVRGILAL
jgi:Fe-S cluster biogenesis protein NfuA